MFDNSDIVQVLFTVQEIMPKIEKIPESTSIFLNGDNNCIRLRYMGNRPVLSYECKRSAFSMHFLGGADEYNYNRIHDYDIYGAEFQCSKTLRVYISEPKRTEIEIECTYSTEEKFHYSLVLTKFQYQLYTLLSECQDIKYNFRIFNKKDSTHKFDINEFYKLFEPVRKRLYE